MKKENSKKIIKQFGKTVAEYRNMLIDNHMSRMGDVEDRRPLERRIVEQFKECPDKLKINLLFLILKIIGAPCDENIQADKQLDIWLQKLAFERLAEMEKSMKK